MLTRTTSNPGRTTRCLVYGTASSDLPLIPVATLRCQQWRALCSMFCKGLLKSNGAQGSRAVCRLWSMACSALLCSSEKKRKSRKWARRRGGVVGVGRLLFIVHGPYVLRTTAFASRRKEAHEWSLEGLIKRMALQRKGVGNLADISPRGNQNKGNDEIH